MSVSSPVDTIFSKRHGESVWRLVFFLRQPCPLPAYIFALGKRKSLPGCSALLSGIADLAGGEFIKRRRYHYAAYARA